MAKGIFYLMAFMTICLFIVSVTLVSGADFETKCKRKDVCEFINTSEDKTGFEDGNKPYSGDCGGCCKSDSKYYCPNSDYVLSELKQLDMEGLNIKGRDVSYPMLCCCEPKRTWYKDEDGDGYVSASHYGRKRPQEGNWYLPSNLGDVNDTVDGNFTTNPRAECFCNKSMSDRTEDCKEQDQNYSLTGDTLWAWDRDGDDYGICYETCKNNNSPQYYPENDLKSDGDCQDNASVNADAPSINPSSTWYYDSDCDGSYSKKSTRCNPLIPSSQVNCNNFNKNFFNNYNSSNKCTNSYCKLGDYSDNCDARTDDYRWYLSTNGRDCDDNNESLYVGTLWKKDADDDGRWGDKALQCEDPGGNWSLEGNPIQNSLSPTNFDCDDNNKSEPPFPISCYCSKEFDGKGFGSNSNTNPNLAVCKNQSEDSFTNRTGRLTSSDFEPHIVNTGFKWYDSERKFDYNGEPVRCPKKTCPLDDTDEANETGKACAEPGTFWNDEADIWKENELQETKGDNLCTLDKDKNEAYWTTRTGRINSLLVEAGEKTGKDFGVYCGKMEKVVNSFDRKIPSTGGASSVNHYFDDIQGGVNSQRLCVLKVNYHYDDNIFKGILPFKKDKQAQKLIIGMPVLERQQEYFNLDFSEPEPNKNWLSETKGMVPSLGEPRGNLYYNNKSKLLFLVQNGLKGAFESTISSSPNRLLVNVHKYLDNPLREFQEGSGSLLNTTFDRFDRSYLSKEGNKYIYSVYENDELFSKFVNPPNTTNESLKKFLAKVCYQGFEGADFDCEGIRDESVFPSDTTLREKVPHVNDTVVLRSDLTHENGERIWRKFSRQIRFQGNVTSGNDDFYLQECSGDNDLGDCPQIECHNSTGCTEDGLCEYEKITDPIDGDGCCPQGYFYENDTDCERSPSDGEWVQPSKGEWEDHSGKSIDSTVWASSGWMNVDLDTKEDWVDFSEFDAMQMKGRFSDDKAQVFDFYGGGIWANDTTIYLEEAVLWQDGSIGREIKNKWVWVEDTYFFNILGDYEGKEQMEEVTWASRGKMTVVDTGKEIDLSETKALDFEGYFAQGTRIFNYTEGPSKRWYRLNNTRFYMKNGTIWESNSNLENPERIEKKWVRFDDTYISKILR